MHADIDAVCCVVDKFLGTGVAAVGLRKCVEAVRLVGLPVRGVKAATAVVEGENSEADVEGEDWDAWDGGDRIEGEPQKANATGVSGDVDVASGLGLWDVEKRLFADNQSARMVLDALGLEVLSETEARALLRRRVELAG